MMGMVTESPEIKGQTLVDETNLFHMMEKKLLHFQKGKYLAQELVLEVKQVGRHILMAKTWDWEINNLNIWEILIPKV
jgi:hypothetical protein